MAWGPNSGGGTGSPDGPAWGPPSPSGYAPPPPPRRRPPTWVWIVAAVAAVALVVGGLALALTGGDDDEVTTRTTRDRDRSDTTEGSPDTSDESPGTSDGSPDTSDESPDTTEGSPDTSDESPDTSDESPDTTDASPSTSRPPLTIPPRPTAPPPTAAPPTTALAPPPTPAPPPPPSGPTQAELDLAVLQGADLVDSSWSRAGDGGLFPVCIGEELPEADLSSGALFLNTATQQTVGNTLQSFPDAGAAAVAFAEWRSVFDCARFASSLDDGRPVTIEIRELDFSDYGPVICDDEFLFFADYFDGDDDLILRTLVAGERCGRNLSLWTYDEDVSIDPDESLSRFFTTFNAPLSRFLALPQ